MILKPGKNPVDILFYRTMSLLPEISKVLETFYSFRCTQGSILDPFLYVLYTYDLPTSRETKLGIFADDTALFATHEDPTIALLNLQQHLQIIEKWLMKWKIKVKESKSSHITLTHRKASALQSTSTKPSFQQTEAVKYLGLHFIVS
jgi:hypothetical protein